MFELWKEGPFAKNCYTKKKFEEKQSAQGNVRAMGGEINNRSYVAQAKLGQRNITVLVDAGAQVSIMSLATAKAIIRENPEIKKQQKIEV